MTRTGLGLYQIILYYGPPVLRLFPSQTFPGSNAEIVGLVRPEQSLNVLQALPFRLGNKEKAKDESENSEPSKYPERSSFYRGKNMYLFLCLLFFKITNLLPQQPCWRKISLLEMQESS